MFITIDNFNDLPISYFFSPLKREPEVKYPKCPRDKDGFIMLVATKDKSYYQTKKKKKDD